MVNKNTVDRNQDLADMAPSEKAAAGEYINSHLEKMHGLITLGNTEENGTQRELSNQLMLLTTVLITASLVALGTLGKDDGRMTVQELLLSLTICFEMFAVAAGIIGYFLTMKYFRKRAKQFENASIYWTNPGRNYRSINEGLEKVSEMTKDEGSAGIVVISVLQAIFLGLTFASMGVAGIMYVY